MITPTLETSFIYHWLSTQVEATEHIQAFLFGQPRATDRQLGDFIRAIVKQELTEHTTYSPLKDMLCKFALNHINWIDVGKQFKASYQYQPVNTMGLELTPKQAQLMRY